MQANRHLLLQLWILAKRIGSILISGNNLSITFRVLWCSSESRFAAAVTRTEFSLHLKFPKAVVRCCLLLWRLPSVWLATRMAGELETRTMNHDLSSRELKKHHYHTRSFAARKTKKKIACSRPSPSPSRKQSLMTREKPY